MNGGGRPRWKNKKASGRSIFISSLLILFLVFFIFYKEISTFILPLSTQSLSSEFSQCEVKTVEKFLWYAPHSGFSNQLSEFKTAILMAAILNRTLIVPPVLDHHAVALGSCPKFRVLEPKQLRFEVWDHAIDLLKEGRLVAAFFTLYPSLICFASLSDLNATYCFSLKFSNDLVEFCLI